MTVDDLIRDLALELGENVNDSDSVAVFTRWIRDVTGEINLMGEWPHVRKNYPYTTTSGGDVILLPDDVGEIISIRRTDTALPLAYIDEKRLVEAGLDLADTGEPAYWTYETIDDTVTQIRLFPVPDSTYPLNIRYESSSADITDEDSELSVPQDFVPVLKHGIRSLYYDQAGSGQQAYSFRQYFELGVARLRAKYEHVRADRAGAAYNDLDASPGWPGPRLPSDYPFVR